MSSKGAAELKVVKRKGFDIEVDAKEAVDLATLSTHENVFLFVPNLIGYARIILAALALHYMPYHPRFSTLLYGASSFLDAADGAAARALNQASEFGAVLDMVTDRCATSCLLCYLASAYPDYALVFQFLITLDFSSHYMHMCSTLTTGSRRHKAVRTEVSRILSWYYNPKVLFTMCAGNELFFVALYLMKWDHTPITYFIPPIVLQLLSPVTSSIHDILQPLLSKQALDTIENLSYAQFVAILTCPISVGKNIINVVQAWKASKVLVGVDLAERAKARAHKE